MSLRYGRIGLRPLSRHDGSAWAEVRRRNADWLGPWDATPPPGGPSAVRSFGRMVRDLDRQARRAQIVPWALDIHDSAAENAPATLAGQVTIGGVQWGSARFAHIGYWIDQRWAGHGFVPTAVAMACDYAFDTMGLHRLEVCIRPENEPSLRVVEKLGLREEGLRERYLHIAGEWRDHRVFVLEHDEMPEGVLARLEQGDDEG